MTHPQQNAPSPNRKVAEAIVERCDNDWSDAVERIEVALDAKDAEAREKVERVVRAVERACTLCENECKDEPLMRGQPITRIVRASALAAANEMREGKE